MVVGLVSSLFGQVSAAFNYTNKGWGEKYQWMSLDEGVAVAAKRNKPLMVVVHNMTCPSCISLKRRFSKAHRVMALSNSFVMVNVEAKELPSDNLFAPDGQYVPRILFFTPNGYLMSDVKNPYRTNNMFTYSDPAFLIDAMKQALKLRGAAP